MKSRSDFKALSLIVHTPYPQAVSFQGKRIFFSIEENDSTIIALGFLHSSRENWSLKDEGKREEGECVLYHAFSYFPSRKYRL